jgi:tyrosyl-tRNA synthetase
VGLDGKQKMSQSLGNYIPIDDPPHDMYGKIMSIPDSLMMDYFELLTDVPDEELVAIRKSAGEGGAQAMDHKMRLARDIVAQFHSESAAREAEEGFVRVFREREAPDEVPMVPKGKRSLPFILHRYGLASSRSEARRLINQGAVEINGHQVTVHVIDLKPGDLIRVGKHRFARVADADKHPQS